LVFLADHEAGTCYASNAYLAKMSGVGKNSIKRCTNELVKAGLLAIGEWHRDRNGHVCGVDYRVTLPIPEPEKPRRPIRDARNTGSVKREQSIPTTYQYPIGTETQYLGATPLREEEVASFLEANELDTNVAGEACRLIKVEVPNWQERVRGLAEKVASDRAAIFAPLLKRSDVEGEEPF
jgi:hypothetical protein